MTTRSATLKESNGLQLHPIKVQGSHSCFVGRSASRLLSARLAETLRLHASNFLRHAMASSALALPFAQLVDVQPDGAGFSAFIHGAWSNYGGVPLGGLFSALAIKAISMFHARDGQPNMRPSSLSMHFLDSPKLGETVKIEVVAERVGLATSKFRAHSDDLISIFV